MADASLLSQLAALGIHPKKGLGQNFLVDPAHRARIVAAADLTPADTVLEVGPGPGVLTELIVAQAGRVIAVELDDRLIPFLRERFADQPHVTIVHADILATDVGSLMREAGSSKLEAQNNEERVTSNSNPAGLEQPATLGERGSHNQLPVSSFQHPVSSYKVVANLPYYITAAAIRHLLEAQPPPAVLALTVQREVAERMVARPPEMSLLALGVQFYCTGRIVGRIPAGAFYPVPKVDSAVVRLDHRPEPVVPGVSAEAFFRVARAGFSQPRKQLRNSLAAGMELAPGDVEAWLAAAGIDPRRRAETLDLSEWGRIVLAR
jgi:16S rRNA (adenine1518-N6/adenine1519-N6)-dimethyltransferase